MINFGIRLKEEIFDAGITPEILSKKINVPQKAIYNWCANISQPKLSGLIKLANYFNNSIDYLLDKENKYNKTIFMECPPFSTQLEKFMCHNNIKPTALGKAIKVDRKQIYRWLWNEAEPQLQNIIKLAEHFNVTIDILIGRQN